MREQLYRVSSNLVAMVVSGKDTREAFRKFLLRSVEDNTWQDLGLLAVIKHEQNGNRIACRVPTALVLLGKLDKPTGLAYIRQISASLTMRDLEHLLVEDSWVLEH